MLRRFRPFCRVWADMSHTRYDGDSRNTLRYWDEATPTPSVAVWEITLRCDLACRHCGSRAGAARDNELDTEQALAVVNQLADAGVREVILIGGEAYLRDDWVQIGAAITARGMACSMVTGGFGFDLITLREAEAAGIAIVGISIDGIAATHDHVRGKIGSFEAAVSAARLVRASKRMTLTVNTQINRLSLPELPRIARLVADLGASAWQVQLSVALGRAADRPDLLLQPYDLLAVMPLLAQLKRDVLEPAGVTFFPGNNVGYFGPHEMELRYGGSHGQIWNGCLAGRAALGIEADGTLKGCPSLPTTAYRAGNLAATPLDQLLANNESLDALGKRTPADLWGHCSSCQYAARCLSGCTWTSHALFGRPGNNPYCHHRALELAREGLRERIVLRSAAPGEPFDHGLFDLVEEPLDAPDAVATQIETALLLARMVPEPDAGMWEPAGLIAATAKRRPAGHQKAL